MGIAVIFYEKFLFSVLLLCMGVPLNAENYSTLSVSYSNTQLLDGDNMGDKEELGFIGVELNSSSLKGFGLQYNYGIGLGSKPMSLEVRVK